MSANWNPWHGCRKFSPGCLNCYVYRMDAKFGRDPSVFSLTDSYLLPLARYRGGKKKGEYGDKLTLLLSQLRPEQKEIMEKLGVALPSRHQIQMIDL